MQGSGSRISNRIHATTRLQKLIAQSAAPAVLHLLQSIPESRAIVQSGQWIVMGHNPGPWRLPAQKFHRNKFFNNFRVLVGATENRQIVKKCANL
ncbi:MAG: hypothetical protein Q8L60_02100 [Gammaproteobacteria bacterium]|nr:hypothetical protein [Gammaproteobacteria bacterium]MDP2347584.1 hypothetical protein [Gammaproteobacteria bacterium]